MSISFRNSFFEWAQKVQPFGHAVKWRQSICLWRQPSTPCQGFSPRCVRADVRPDGRPDAGDWTSCRTPGRTVVGGALVVSGTKKKAFDRGGLVWPPRSNAKDDRTAPKKKTFDRGGPVWPPQSSAEDDRLGGGLEGSNPQPKLKKFENISKVSTASYLYGISVGLKFDNVTKALRWTF